MTRTIVLHICLAFCGLLLLNIVTQCLAFPQMERREIAHVHEKGGQSERINTDDLENNSITSKSTHQPVGSEDPMRGLVRPSATSLNTVSPINKETHSMGGELVQLNSPDVDVATEPVVSAGEEVFGSSQPERTSPERWLPKAMVTNPITATALIIDEKKEPFSSTNVQPIGEGTTEATQVFLKYMDNQLFTTESQEGVSLGHSTSSFVNAKKKLTTNPRAEKFEAGTEQRTTSCAGTEPTTGTESGSLLSDREKPSWMRADNTQATVTKHRLTTSEYTLSVELETDSLLGAPEVTVSVSTAVAASSVVSDEWDDTKLESVSQIKTPKLGDNTEIQVRMEISQTTQVTESGVEGMERGEPLTEPAHRALGLPKGETRMGTAPLIPHEDSRSSAFTEQSSFTPTKLMEDTKSSVGNLFQNTAGFLEPTKENNAMVFLETPVSISEYESETYQPLGNTFKDIATQEMTTVVQEAEAALSLVTQEQQVSTLEVTRENDLMDTVTGPNEDFFTPILGSPVTPPGIMEEAPSISPTFPDSEASSERRTVVPSITHVTTAASYGLDQLESEEGEEDEDEEDEEEEDDEEEDEEDEEEDKGADSLDESMDGDTELRGFTVPGLTSQEPDVEQENMDLLEGATYQVPDALEWEQQDQGLVRSWMEKLKDKAGYMSGMLVPVGVGIAGALFILGALYSIKVMNRRRRNGFKRHKRKQREFNSMQDRVMLLADSSEDEF
uniref:Armadillo like helical domain containing 4 n=1 Tax=Rousettus aegyptiacus TaxID=9407 RepID=A0A7J8IG60_ROUAE|nr:armadillo like helical domain containing 4 [Rousettus aegyptiacus]